MTWYEEGSGPICAGAEQRALKHACEFGVPINIESGYITNFRTDTGYLNQIYFYKIHLIRES